MGKRLNPATKRAITTLRNQGFAVEIQYASKTSRAVTATPAVPTVVSPDPKFECITIGCYKQGHAFSDKGAFGVKDAAGDQVVQGHFTLNPTHGYKAV